MPALKGAPQLRLAGVAAVIGAQATVKNPSASPIRGTIQVRKALCPGTASRLLIEAVRTLPRSRATCAQPKVPTRV